MIFPFCFVLSEILYWDSLRALFLYWPSFNSFACRDVSYNRLSGSFPSWVNQPNMQLYVFSWSIYLRSLVKLLFLYTTKMLNAKISTYAMHATYFTYLLFDEYFLIVLLYQCSNFVANNFPVSSVNSRLWYFSLTNTFYRWLLKITDALVRSVLLSNWI